MTAYATEVRDAAFAIIDRLGIANAMRVVPTFQWQPDQDCPAVGVYMRRDRMTEDGDQSGVPKFVHAVTIGVSVLVKASDSEALTFLVDEIGQRIVETVLSDAEFNSKAFIEGVTDVDQTAVFPPSASKYMADIRTEFTVVLRSDWPPVLLDEYAGASLTTRPRGASPDAPVIRTKIPAPTA